MRGVITLVFDDGYEAVYTHVVPLLNSYKFPAVFAVPLETESLAKSTGESLTPWQAWLPLKQQGHEVAAHGIHHTDVRKLEGEALINELKIPRESLSATTLVYPGGATNETVVAAVKKYYSAARTTQYGFESVPPTNPWQLKTIDYTKDNWSVAQANLRALWAVARNRWLIETYHLVDINRSLLHHRVPFVEFKRHLEFIHKLPVAIQTINETISRRHH